MPTGAMGTGGRGQALWSVFRASQRWWLPKSAHCKLGMERTVCVGMTFSLEVDEISRRMPAPHQTPHEGGDKGAPVLLEAQSKAVISTWPRRV